MTTEDESTKEQIVDDAEDRWRRALAELDNVRKRCARQIEEERWAERQRVAAQWLPVLDNLDRAMEHSPSGDDPFVKGVAAVRDQAMNVLAGLGLPRYEETGVPFDPFRHEAVAVVDDAGAPPGTVVRVVRPGYGQGERPLRPAAVVVVGQRD